MTTANEVQIIVLQELCNCIGAKNTRNPSITIVPTTYPRVGIRPKQITQETTIRNVRWPRNLINLVQPFEVGRKSSMHAKYLFTNEGRDRQAIKAFGKYLPQPNVEPPLTFIIESINTVDFGIFMVSP